MHSGNLSQIALPNMWLLVLILSNIVINRERLINISGVLFRENLSWKYYIKKINKKLSKSIRIF